jgi:hypothetical protein
MKEGILFKDMKRVQNKPLSLASLFLNLGTRLLLKGVDFSHPEIFNFRI